MIIAYSYWQLSKKIDIVVGRYTDTEIRIKKYLSTGAQLLKLMTRGKELRMFEKRYLSITMFQAVFLREYNCVSLYPLIFLQNSINAATYGKKLVQIKLNRQKECKSQCRKVKAF